MRALLLLLLTAGWTGATHAATLQVVVTSVRSDRGAVLVAVCPQADFLKPHCPWYGRAPARAGEVLVTVEGVPPGVYAVQAFQDENGNGRIDRNFFGMPEEGIGFSRDAPFHFGPPRFDDAAIRLLPGGGQITLHLRYYG